MKSSLKNVLMGWVLPFGIVALVYCSVKLNWFRRSDEAPNPIAAWPNEATVAANRGNSLPGNSLGRTEVSSNDRNRQAGAALLANITDPVARAAAISALTANWLKTDPKAALDWAISLSDGEARARTLAVNDIISTWARADPGAVLAYLRNSRNSAVLLRAAPAIAQSLGMADAGSAMNFVNDLPNGPLKDQALNNALAGIAKTNLADAWTYASKLPEGASQISALNSIVASTATSNPGQLAALIVQLPEGSSQIKATSTLSAVWVNQDNTAFNTWVNKLPEGDMRDAALVQFDTSAQATRHPSATFNRANTITNPDLRAAQLQVVLTSWVAKTPQAALDAVQKANLTDAQKTTILQSLAQATAPGN